MALDFVNPPARPTLNVLLYAGPKAGKSTAAASAPGPLLYVNADGPGAIRYARRIYGDAKFHEVAVEAANAASVLDEVILHLKSGKAQERTVVIDTIGELYGRVLENISGGAQATLPQYQDTASRIERFCRALRDLDVNVVFLAHELAFRNEENGSMERVPFAGTNSPKLSMKICAMVDVLGYAIARQAENGEMKYGAQLVPGGGRNAGDRTGVLGKARATDLSEWIETANSAPRSGDSAPITIPEPPPAQAPKAVQS